MDCVDGLTGIEWLRHFFPSVWDLMDYVGGLKGKSGVRRFFPISVGFDGLCTRMEWKKWRTPNVRRFFFPSRWDLMDCAMCTQSQMLDQGRT